MNLGSKLTSRELEIVGLFVEGVPTPQIGRALNLSNNTVRNHIQNILTKLGVHSRSEAVSVAVRAGLISGP